MKIIPAFGNKMKPEELESFDIQEEKFYDMDDIPKISLFPHKIKLFGLIFAIFTTYQFILAALLCIVVIILTRKIYGPELIIILLGAFLFWINIKLVKSILQDVRCSKKIRKGCFQTANAVVTDKKVEIRHSEDNDIPVYYLFLNGIQMNVTNRLYQQTEIQSSLTLVFVENILVGYVDPVAYMSEN